MFGFFIYFSPMNFPEKLHIKLSKRKADNLFRELYSHHEMVDFSSNDYLGFSKNTNISEAVEQHMAQLKFVNGSTGSRLLSGNHSLHNEVEQELAEFFKTPAALIFNSGYDANVGLLSSIPQHGDADVTHRTVALARRVFLFGRSGGNRAVRPRLSPWRSDQHHGRRKNGGE